MQDTPSQSVVAEQIQQLILAQRTLHIASIHRDGQLEASYAPFVCSDGRYYIYVSELASHCQNIIHSGRCALLVIEGEKEAKTPFARRRVSLHCSAQEVIRDSPEFAQIMLAFHTKFGKFMAAIDSMVDFHMLALSPLRGAYVAGFGRAYTFEGADFQQVSWRNDQGHRYSASDAQNAQEAMQHAKKTRNSGRVALT